MKFFLHKTRVLKTRDLCGIFTFAKRVFWTRVSKTRDAIFHNSFKRCLTYYIEMLNVVSLLIPPTSTLLTKGKVSSLMKTKSKRQRKFKETWVSKKWNKSGATLDERWRRRRNKDKKEMDDDRRSGIATRKVKTDKPLKMPLNLGIFHSFFLSLFRWFTLYRPIFIFRPISNIFPGMAGTSRYLERIDFLGIYSTIFIDATDALHCSIKNHVENKIFFFFFEKQIRNILIIYF